MKKTILFPAFPPFLGQHAPPKKFSSIGKPIRMLNTIRFIATGSISVGKLAVPDGMMTLRLLRLVGSPTNSFQWALTEAMEVHQAFRFSHPLAAVACGPCGITTIS